jgi:hypothetical protein
MQEFGKGAFGIQAELAAASVDQVKLQAHRSPARLL